MAFQRESLSRNHRQALFNSTRTIKTPQIAKSVYKNKRNLKLRQNAKYSTSSLINSQLGEDTTFVDKKN